MSHISLQEFDKTFCVVEKTFNVVGWIPGVSSISGPLRFAAGKIQLTAFAALGFAMLSLGYILNRSDLARKASPLLGYALHGLANMGRGILETIPILGNITTIIYDAGGSRFAYQQESLCRRIVVNFAV